MSMPPRAQRIWLSPLQTTALNAAELTQRMHQGGLDARETNRARAFTDPALAAAWVAARAFQRRAMATELGCAPAALSFSAGEGKPHLLQPSAKIDYSFTHTKGYAALGFAREGQIGVDIERLDRVVQPGIAERWFASRERAALARLDASAATAHRLVLWVLKEAAVKALGVGIANNLDQIAFEIHGDALEIHLAEPMAQRAPFARAAVWTLPTGHRLAWFACSQSEPPPLPTLVDAAGVRDPVQIFAPPAWAGSRS